MSTVVSLICLGPSFQKMTHHFLLHGLLWPTNLEKNLKPWIYRIPQGTADIWYDSLCPINNLSVIKGQFFLGWTSTKLWLMCFAQRHKAVTPVRLEPAAPQSRVKHSTTEPLRSHEQLTYNQSYYYYRCESLAELLWRNRQQIIKVDLLRQQLPIEIPQGTADIQPELNKTVTGLLSTLVTR